MRVCMYMCIMCGDQRSMSNILLNSFTPCFFEIVSLTEPGIPPIQLFWPFSKP